MSLAEPLAALRHQIDAADAAGRFPAEAVEMFVGTGLLAAPLPVALGGSGWGASAEQGPALAETLRQLGKTWLPLARVYEGHVNALRLIWRYGTPAQLGRAAADAPSHLFAIWAAEVLPVELIGGVLHGSKSFASAAGLVTRPLVTARHDGREVLAWLSLPADRARIIAKPDLVGMRGAGTAAIDLDGLAVADRDIIGEPDDYMRQPEISLGAWRVLPGLLGALQALTGCVATELRARRRTTDPTQLARFGQMRLACETAALWVDRVAAVADAPDATEDAAALVKLGRHAIDRACTLVLDHATRAAGLAAFVRPHPIERICRDIDTYRRQPALDQVLLEAATHFLELA